MIDDDATLVHRSATVEILKLRKGKGLQENREKMFTKPGRVHNVFTHCRKDPNVEVCRMTQNHAPDAKTDH